MLTLFYDLRNGPRNPLNNFALKNCLLVVTNIVNKLVYCRYRIAFDGAGSCSFGDEFARDVLISPADIS